jgi:hypothetical protein
MSTAVPRRSGKYSPAQGLQLQPRPYRRKPPVPCPDGVGDQARDWWAVWAASPYAHEFTTVEWLDLADTARLMGKYYETLEPRYLAEARQHTAALFGVATRARLHITLDAPAAPAAPAPARQRSDPRLKAV